MDLTGTIRNGVVVFDEPTNLPDGTRVWVDVDISEMVKDLEYPHPMAPYDREKEIALLKERHQAHLAGERSYTVEEVMAEMERDFGFKRAPEKK